MINKLFTASKEARNIEHISNELYNLSNYTYASETETEPEFDYNDESIIGSVKNFVTGNSRYFYDDKFKGRLLKPEKKQSFFKVITGDKKHSNTMLKHLQTNKTNFMIKDRKLEEVFTKKKKKIDDDFAREMRDNHDEGKKRIEALRARINMLANNDAVKFKANIDGLKREEELAGRYFSEREQQIKDAYKAKRLEFDKELNAVKNSLKKEKRETRVETLKHTLNRHREDLAALGAVGLGYGAYKKIKNRNNKVQSDISEDTEQF